MPLFVKIFAINFSIYLVAVIAVNAAIWWSGGESYLFDGDED